jgi:PKD repeat protein
MCGAQDNGTYYYNDGEWSKVCGGDGMECLINPSNENQLFCSSQYGNIRRSNDGGNSFNGYVGGINETGAWVTPYAMDPNNTNIVYAGYESLWRRNGGGNTWTVINDANSSTINQIEVAEQNSQVIYFSKGNSISRTLDGGDTWTFINSGITSLSKTDLDARPEDAMEIYVTCSGYTDGQKVYRSFDGGSTWENISFNLPNIPCNTVICEAGSDGGVYVGMDVGVYYLDNTLTNWVPFSEGIPNVIISELEIQNSAGKLRAATYGRGLWETDLHEPSAIAPQVDFVASEHIICAGGTIEYTEQAINAAPNWTWSFPGGTPATSTEAQPVVTYNMPGVYDVTLTMGNQAGNTTEEKTMLITVLEEQGEAMPFAEGFETFDFDSDNRWLLEDLDSDGVVWQVNENVGSQSGQCIWIDNFQNNDGNRDNIFSNTIDVSSASGLSLEFDVAFAQRNEDNADRLKVFTSGNCGANWQLNESLSGSNELPSAAMSTEPFTPTSSEWQTFEVLNISPSVLTESFRLRFEYQNNGGNNIYLDNINLSFVSGLVDIDIRNLNLSVFPNPASDETTLRYSLLSNKAVSFQILDLTGRVVYQENLGTKGFGEHQTTVNLSDLSSGMYSIQMIIDGKVGAKKLMVD